MPTRILSGNFDSKHRLDAVILNENGTAFCKGPDYRKCVPIAQLPILRTIPITDVKGRAALLQYDGSIGQVCHVNASGFRVSLDCRPMNFSRLQDYKAHAVNNAKVLMVEGIDGTYACSELSGAPKCGLIQTGDGQPIKPVRRPRGAPKFTPPDQKGKECTFKHDGFECVDAVRLGLADHEFTLFARPASIMIFDDDYSVGWDDYIINEVWNNCPSGLCDSAWWSYQFSTDPRREACERDCQTWCAHDEGICLMATGITASATRNAEAAGLVLAVCMGITAGQRSWCMWRCGR